jgi:rhodanese-related sulfurtransferase
MGPIGWIAYAAGFIGLITYMRMRRAGQVSKQAAAAYIKQGAIIVDVRSPDEYNRGHLSQAFNMPVNEINSLLPGKVQDKNRVILVHCQSGMRGKKAILNLTGIGYTQVFSLGSYERAFKIVSGRSL